jgi:RNA polymerase sigma factor for flagellar operon FliA
MNELIVEHTALASRVATKMARRAPQAMRDDLVSAGFVGLTEAARRWDGVSPFVPFALQRIRGAVLDEMRRGDMMPRRVRSTARKVAATIKSLEGGATEEAIAAKLGVTVAEYQTNLAKLVAMKVDSLDADDAAPLMSEDDNAEQQVARREQIARVRAAIEKLDKRDATLLGLRFIEEMTCEEVGLTLQLSAARVCQLLKRAVERLRALLVDECLDYAA